MMSTVKHDVMDPSSNERNNKNNPEIYRQSPPKNNSEQPSKPSPIVSFPVKLHYMLTEVEKDGLSHVVSWQTHGRCFMVHNRKKFVESFLSNWFLQSKFASFQRQLNMYGFRRITSAYYHKFFLRGKPNLLTHILRITVKGTGPRTPSCSESEPNFYDMPPLLPNSTSTSAPIPAENAHTHKAGQNPAKIVLQSFPSVLLFPSTSMADVSQPVLQQQISSAHHSNMVQYSSSSFNLTNNNNYDISSNNYCTLGTQDYNANCFPFTNGTGS